MTKYYTGRGDDGTTGTLSDKRVGKDDLLITSIGDLDELNSALGIAIADIEDTQRSKELQRIQNEIFILGANLASTNGRMIGKAQIKPEAMAKLEKSIKELGSKIPDLREFVLPGGSRTSSYLHLARAIARRAERSIIAASREYKIDKNVIAYLNRLSSYLFVAALYINAKQKIKESHPGY